MIVYLVLDIRLAGGTSVEGRVEVYYDNTWGTVCDDDWDIDDARVVCRQLGFRDAEAALGNARFGQGTGPIFLDEVDCMGYESSIFSCSHKGIRVQSCDHSEDAGVRCKDKEGKNY